MPYRTMKVTPVRTFLPYIVAAVTVSLIPNPAAARFAQAAGELTLDQAVREAQASHPAIRAAQAQVNVALGIVSSADRFPFNPALVATVAPARAPGVTYTNLEVGVSQAFELGGKRGARSLGAAAGVDVTRLGLVRVKQLIGWQVEQAFYRAIIANQRLATTIENEQIARSLQDASEHRLRLGAGTQLDLNLAVSGVARATRERLAAERAVNSAILALTAAVGRDLSDPVGPRGALPDLPAPPLLDTLVTIAVQARADYQAVVAQGRVAQAGVAVARALVWPDATIGFVVGREEELTKSGLTVGLSLPLWNRNQGGRIAARAEVLRLDAVAEEARRNLEREIRDAHQAYVSVCAAETAFGGDALRRFADNLRLAHRSFESGKINLVEYTVVRRDLVEAQLAYLDARADVIDAFITLEMAVGQGLLPGPVEQ